MPKKRSKVLENRRKKKPGYDVKDLTPKNAFRVMEARMTGEKIEIENYIAYR